MKQKRPLLKDSLTRIIKLHRIVSESLGVVLQHLYLQSDFMAGDESNPSGHKEESFGFYVDAGWRRVSSASTSFLSNPFAQS